MSIFNRKAKPTEVDPLNNEDLELLYRMMFRQVNRGVNIPSFINKTDYIEKGFVRNATVYSIISLRAAAAKGIPWLVYKIKDIQKLKEYRNINRKDLDLHKTIQTKAKALEEVDGTKLNQLLEKPNPAASWQDIIEGLFTYRDITGDAYLAQVDNPISKEILQVYLLPADKTSIVGGPFSNPVAGYRFADLSRDIILPEKVMHWKYFNPRWANDGRQLYGLSPLVAASQNINSDSAGLNNETASFANEGVKGVLTGTESKNDDQFEFTKPQIDTLLKKLKRATGRAKAGGGNILFNRAPLNYTKIGETPVDLGVLSSRKYNKEILCNIFHILPPLLSSEASTLDNIKEARKALMTMSVMPDMDSLRDNLI